MIDGIRFVPKRVDIVKSGERSTNRSIADNRPASNRKVKSHLAGDGRAIYHATTERRVRTDSVKGRRRIVWVLQYDWFALGVRICRRRHGQKLIGVAKQSQMRTLASDVRGRQYEVVRQFFLDAQVPLLDVRP